LSFFFFYFHKDVARTTLKLTDLPRRQAMPAEIREPCEVMRLATEVPPGSSASTCAALAAGEKIRRVRARRQAAEAAAIALEDGGVGGRRGRIEARSHEKQVMEFAAGEVRAGGGGEGSGDGAMAAVESTAICRDSRRSSSDSPFLAIAIAIAIAIASICCCCYCCC
jgi:hypothetical protein